MEMSKNENSLLPSLVSPVPSSLRYQLSAARKQRFTLGRGIMGKKVIGCPDPRTTWSAGEQRRTLSHEEQRRTLIRIIEKALEIINDMDEDDDGSVGDGIFDSMPVASQK